MTGVPPTRFPGFGHDRLARGDPFENLHPIAGTAAGPDPLFHGLPVLDDEHLLEAGEGHYRRGRNHDGGAVGLDHDLGARERAGAKLPVLVRHLGFDVQRAVLLLDGRAQAGDTAGVHRGVSLQQDPDRLPDPHGGSVPFRHRHPEPERVDPDQGEHRSAGGQVLAHRSAAFPNGPVDRRAQHRVGQLLPGQGEARAPLGKHFLTVPDLFQGGLVAALGDQKLGLGRVDLGPGDQILFRELSRAIPIQARLLEHRPGLAHQRGLLGIDAFGRAVPGETQSGAHLAEGGFGLIHAKAEIRRVEAGENLPFPHRAAQVDRDFAHAAGDLEPRDDLFVGGERPGDGHRARKPAYRRGDDAHRMRLLGLGAPRRARRRRILAAADPGNGKQRRAEKGKGAEFPRYFAFIGHLDSLRYCSGIGQCRESGPVRIPVDAPTPACILYTVPRFAGGAP